MLRPGDNLSTFFTAVPRCPNCKPDTEWKSFPDGAKHLSLVPPLDVVRCSDCRLLFMHPRPSEDAINDMFAGVLPPDLKIYAGQPANYGAVTEQRKQLFQERIRQLSASYDLVQKPRMLDIGASSGTMVELAKELGWDAYGIEPSLDGVAACKSKNLNVVQSKAEKLPFPHNFFDLVHSHHVFEHLNNPFEAAAEVYRVLKPGGEFFIEVPNQFDNIHFFRYRIMGRVPVRKRGIRSIHHFYFFSKRTFYNLFKQQNFVDVKVRSIYLSPRKGLAYLGSLITRIIGGFYLGGYLIQVSGKKPE